MPSMVKEDDYFSLGDLFFCITDIATSVHESFYGAINFWVQLWTEFYIQLTTISWLSVRQDGRDWTDSKEEAKEEASWGLGGLAEGLLERLSFPLGRGEAGDDLVQRDGVVVSRADEWVRKAEELARNNTRARAKLALTSVVRRSAADSSSEDVALEKEEDDAGDWGFSALSSWMFDSTSSEESPGDLTSEEPELVSPSLDTELNPGEEHLELFYIASFLLLLFMIYHIVHKHLSYSRKKAVFLQNISK